MPSPTNLLLGSLSLSQIQKFIPKQWSKSNSKKTSVLISLDFQIDPSMIDALFTSLKDSASHGQLSKAFQTFSLIQRCRPSCCYEILVQSLSCLVLCCKELNSFREGKQLHGYVVSSGIERDPLLVPKLVTFYSGFKLLGEAHLVAETSDGGNPVPWNVLIASYVNVGLCKEGLYAFKQMVRRGIQPDHFTFPSVLKACAEELNQGYGREVHKSIMDATSSSGNLFVQNALVSMYGKFGEVGTARMVFDRMSKRDDISWNSMISGYASMDMWTEAFELFESMKTRDDVEASYITWNCMTGGCLRMGNYKEALGFVSEMRVCGIHLDPVAVINGLGACSHLTQLRLGKEIHGLAIRNSSYAYDNVKNALITMYSRCKDLRHARTVFCLMETRSVITWNSMIAGYTNWDQSEEASLLLREMLLSGFEPNSVTIASILPLCGRIANLQHGKEFHCYITRREEFTDYLLLWNALVDMYARSGKILAAQRLFDMLSSKDKVTYTSLIAGYGIQGKGHIAIELFDEMIDLKIMPDHVTMIAVLSACSHSGLVGRGQVLFEKMSTVYRIEPHLEHFACMVDLYGRAGLIEEAIAMIERMHEPCRPTAAMWATIVGACRIHGKIELGEWAAGKLFELKPQHSGYYVLVANMYAAAGCWQKLAMIRTYMRDLGVEKDPGCAWLDLGAGFSPFLVGDTSNTKSDEIYPLLGGLSKQLTEAGHVMSDDDLVAEVCSA